MADRQMPENVQFTLCNALMHSMKSWFREVLRHLKIEYTTLLGELYHSFILSSRDRTKCLHEIVRIAIIGMEISEHMETEYFHLTVVVVVEKMFGVMKTE